MVSIDEILKYSENQNLDFKEKYWSDNADLIHDILCMANSLISGDKRIVLGVKDDKKVVGVENDPDRKNKQNITNVLIQNNLLNEIPGFELITEKMGIHEVDILIIKDLPRKPYFLNNDYPKSKVKKNKVVRAGVVYTRNNDSNTPLDSTANQAQIMEMWEEKLGLRLSPYQRINKYLEQADEWKEIVNKGECTYHFEKFPEFTVTFDLSSSVINDFQEEWTLRFPDKKASSHHVFLKYHSTIIECLLFVACDGGRYFVPCPTKEPKGFFIRKDSLSYLVWFLDSRQKERNMENFLMRSGVSII